MYKGISMTMKRLYVIISLCMLLFAVTNTTAQKVHYIFGFVRDSLTGKGIDNATITISFGENKINTTSYYDKEAGHGYYYANVGDWGGGIIISIEVEAEGYKKSSYSLVVMQSLGAQWANISLEPLYMDSTPPTSNVRPLSSFYQIAPAKITAKAYDNLGGSGVYKVELFYRYSSNNKTWGDWKSYEIDYDEPWEWNFDPEEGLGFYQLYTIATDKANNTESPPKNPDVTLQLITPSKYTFHLRKGWNLIAIPFIKSLTGIETANDLIDAIGDACYQVMKWDSEEQDWITKIADGPGINFEIVDGEAYFAFVTEETDFEVTGLQITAKTLHLHSGWNLVSYTDIKNRSAKSIAENVTNCTIITTWNATLQEYEQPFIVAVGTKDFVVKQGMGLFIYVRTESEWRL